MATTATIIDGKAVAVQVLGAAAARVRRVRDETGTTPTLATVLVGDDPASATYVRMKAARCEAVGMRSQRIELSESTDTASLVETIRTLSADPTVHGILLQHPVPGHVDERAAFEAIRPEKDVDGVSIQSFGAIALDPGGPAAFAPCTPAGIMRLLEAYGAVIEGCHAVVVGRSSIVGKPMAMMLLAAHATVTICHSRTQHLSQIVQEADLVVAAVGKPHFVRGAWIREGAIVIDAGYNRGNVGDVEYEVAADRASMITPVPGGVGPMTIATLIDQTSMAAARQLGIDAP